MKTLFLLRHAKSSWKKPTLADFDRPLKGRGRKACKLMGAYLDGHGIKPHIILCSAAKRARQTLLEINGEWPLSVPTLFKESLYHASPITMLQHLRGLDDAIASAMIIGHNPGLEDLAYALTGSGDVEALEAMERKFPTAALAVLSAPIGTWRELGPGGARLDRFVQPKDL
ncbi:MAG TPA: histidine phosphatase family protein [Rhodospirillales bacterium]|mgnify:CR=1 FL=1|nr:histidine phosphatase family protein [Rhodospirillales bacterium]